MPEGLSRHIAGRRTVLAAGFGAALGIGLQAPARATGGPNPFTLGVASGDPTPDGVVLWTRLAVDPLADDGHGGMPNRAIDVEWEVAEDERFGRVVQRGLVTTVAEFGHSVHAEVHGLRPGREYFYRFRTGRHISVAGRTRTAPAPGTLTSAITFCMSSCAQWEHGHFTTYRRLAEDDPDLVLHLGDYLYEHGPGGYPVGSGIARPMHGDETRSLTDYRVRHALYKSDPDLQFAHAAAPWLIVWDDHEVDNNWAGYHHEVVGDTPKFRERRRAAFQAYYENMPLRRTSLPRGDDLRLHRRVEWGGLANFHLLDTRQYRDDQACGGLVGPCGQESRPDRTITGDEQEAWLLDGFHQSRARWDFLGQQVMMAQLDSAKGPLTVTSMDTWDGYTASRDRVARGWLDAGVRNPVVLTGDIHEHYANDLSLHYDDPDSPVIGSELVTTSVTSGGDAEGEDFTGDPENPHIRFHDEMRGYVRARVTESELTADFRVLPYVRQPGAPARTKASLHVADGVPGWQP